MTQWGLRPSQPAQQLSSARVALALAGQRNRGPRRARSVSRWMWLAGVARATASALGGRRLPV
jgi:hypothetical protein